MESLLWTNWEDAQLRRRERVEEGEVHPRGGARDKPGRPPGEPRGFCCGMYETRGCSVLAYRLFKKGIRANFIEYLCERFTACLNPRLTMRIPTPYLQRMQRSQPRYECYWRRRWFLWCVMLESSEENVGRRLGYALAMLADRADCMRKGRRWLFTWGFSMTGGQNVFSPDAALSDSCQDSRLRTKSICQKTVRYKRGRQEVHHVSH